MKVLESIGKKWYEKLLSQQNGGILMQTANDILKHDIIPQHAKSYLTDPNMLMAGLQEYNKSPMKLYRCPDCNRTFNAPKSWAIQHAKWHHMQKDAKENEIRETKFNPYQS